MQIGAGEESSSLTGMETAGSNPRSVVMLMRYWKFAG
jgi:hypothetical protein